MRRELLVLILCAPSALPQTFDAATVKVGGPPPQTLKTMRGGPGTSDPNRFISEHTTLANLMMRANGVRADQIQGPDWIKDFADDHAVYTVNAVISPGATEEQFRVMLQRLLADRFHLVTHRSTKEFPGYDLTLADGGATIKACAVEGEPSDPGQKACPQLPRGSTMTTSMSHGIGAWGAIRRRFIMTMADFSVNLGQAINESKGLESGIAVPRVTDRTGLTGTYDIELRYAGVIALPGMALPPMNDVDSAPALAVALEKQLGLKLVRTKDVPVEILVIDHADKIPAEN